MVELILHLWGKPEWEIDNVDDVKQIKAIIDGIRERVHKNVDVARKLIDNGWKWHITLYDIVLQKDVSKEEAEKELRMLGFEDYIEYLDDWNDNEE